MEPADLWRFLPGGYLATVALELPWLWWGLSRRHSGRRRVAAAFWLTACTYPIVVLVLPLLFPAGLRWAYLVAAETFAPLAECALFTATAHAGVPTSERRRDWLVIVAANLCSFLVGEAYYAWSGG